MSERKDFEFNVGGRQVPPVVGFAVLILVLAALFFIARGIFWLLSILALPALIITLIVDYRVVLGYIKWVINLTRRNIIVGLVVVLLSVLGYSILSFGLLLKALFNRKVRQIEKEQRQFREGELIDFEEVDSKPLDLDRLPERREQPRASDKYDQFFEDQP